MMFQCQRQSLASDSLYKRVKDRTESAMTEQVLLESTPLNALDRCDRCGAQAYVRAVLATGGELMFCAHHGKEYAEKLAAVAVKIQDETDRLVESK